MFQASWFKAHRDKDILGTSVIAWECDIFEVPGVDFYPVLIKHRTVSIIDQIHPRENAFFISPLIDF